VRSLLLRILLASLATILVSLVVFVAALVTLVGPVNERLIHHFQARQIEDARDALARGGPAAAAAYLERADRSLGATHYLTDSRGIDPGICTSRLSSPASVGIAPINPLA